MYNIVIFKQAQKDKEKVKNVPALKKNVDKLLAMLRVDPFQIPPEFEKLLGDLTGYFSRRLNKQHRLVYEVVGNEVRIISMWLHYDNARGNN